MQQTAYFTAIVGIDDAGQNIDALLYRQSGSGSDASVEAFRYRDRKAGPDHSALIRIQNNRLDRIEIQSCRGMTPAGGQHRVGIKLLEAQTFRLIHTLITGKYSAEVKVSGG